MRVFKTRVLAKFTKQNGISDASLVGAVDDAMRGLIGADLGGHVIKQRVARPGQGKRSSFRMLIGYRSDLAIFLFGFAKNERENIDGDQLKTLRELVAAWFAADEKKIAQALADGIFDRGTSWQRRQKQTDGSLTRCWKPPTACGRAA